MDALDKAKIEIDIAQKKIVWEMKRPEAPNFDGIC